MIHRPPAELALTHANIERAALPDDATAPNVIKSLLPLKLKVLVVEYVKLLSVIP